MEGQADAVENILSMCFRHITVKQGKNCGQIREAFLVHAIRAKLVDLLLLAKEFGFDGEVDPHGQDIVSSRMCSSSRWRGMCWFRRSVHRP